MLPLLTLQDFDPVYEEIPDLQVGMEQYNQFRFIRENHVFRAAQIGYRISRIDDKFQLGFGSLLHILDNATYPVFSDVPRVSENPLIANENYKKWIFHVREFQKDGPMQPWDEKYIYRLAGLNSALMRFKSEQKTNFRYLTNLMDIPRKKESLTIINHNPLFRAYVFGKLKYYRKVQLVLASVINTVLSLPVDKLQYIHIPITPRVFVKESFFKSKNRWDIASIKYPESFHWIFMAHLLNFWDTKCNTSWFEAIPQDRWKDINFVLTVPGQDTIWNGLFLNLGQIAELNTKNRYYIRLVNHINTLASSGYIPITTLQEKMQVEVVTSDTVNHSEVPSTSDAVTDEEEIATDAQIEEKAIKDEDTLTKVIKEHDRTPENEESETTSESIVARITKPLIPITQKVVTPLKPTVNIGDVRLGATSASRMSRIHVAPALRNITEAKVPTTTIDAPVAEMRAHERIEERETRVKSFIAAQETLTPKQKERCERLATVYKDLTIHGRRVEEILTKDNDMSLTDNVIEDIVKDLPDKSMKSSRIISFDEMYMKKTFTKDLVSIATSFAEQGMFLTGVEETPIVNELTHAKQYKLNYEDHTGKKHTIRFSIPTVDKDGSCLINGTRKVLKKQILTLPICQTSPTRVSLSSNFNKTIVERNVAKAHSFLPYVIRIVELGGTLVHATYGNLELNLSLSYDYAILATKYRTIDLRSNRGTNITLCFDYYNRYEFLFTNFTEAMHDQVSAHEKEYGVCFAVDNNVVCGYVDTANKVTWLDIKKNVVVEGPTSIASTFVSNYPADISAKIGTITEWTDLKILDKQFPIIFILGYKYGLTETLKHLGVDYKIIGKRTTEIYEDLTVLGTTTDAEDGSILEIDGAPSELAAIDEMVATESLQLTDSGVPEKLPKYFHITPYDLGAAVTMIAKVPNGAEHFGGAEDAALPRICVSTSIDGAVISLRYVRFEKAAFRDLGYVDLFVYGYDGPKDPKKIITTEELTKHRLVYDAHVTQETWITENTRLKKIGAIRVYNKIKYEVRYTDFDMQFNARKSKTACLKWEWISVEKCTALPWKYELTPGTEALAIPKTPLLWHITGTKVDSDTLKKYGLLSPAALLKKDKDLFEKTSYETYKTRAASFLKKNHVTNEDIITYLDHSPKRDGVTSGCLFMSFGNHGAMPYLKDVDGHHEISVRIAALRKYCKEKILPVLVDGKDFMEISWDTLMSNYRQYCNAAYEGAISEQSKKSDMGWKYIPHIAIDCKEIPSSLFATTCVIGSSKVIATEAVQEKARYEFKSDDIVIKFKDCRLVINRYPLEHSLIVAGLDFFDTTKYFMEDFDQPDVYFSLLTDKRIRINYLKGIDAFFQFFIDDITRDVLEQMNEPTNVRDLLIRSTELLTTLDHREASSMANHRIRSYEQFNAIVYNEMSRQMASYMVRQGKGNVFSVNPEAIYQRIIKNESFTIAEQINPIHDIKEKTAVTYSGMGGRTAQSFVVNDRRYPKDAVGIMSEATVDSGKVAINAFLSVDPSVANTRGIFIPKEPEDNDPTQMLSSTALLMPCSTNDDSKRVGFISIQLSHVVPTKESDVCRIRTGFERLVAHRTSNTFAGVARMDGVVSKVDMAARMIRVDYKDGSADIFTFGEDYTDISGFMITQKMRVIVEQGDKVKQNDIVCYNEEFFKMDPYDKQVDYVHGLDANVVLMECDGTLEDSNQMTRSFGKKLAIYPTIPRTVELTADCIVHDIVKVGQHVVNTDPLLIFEEGESEMYGKADEELTDMLSRLNRRTPTAKSSGEIVRIEAFYSCPLSEMHPSLRKIVTAAIKFKNARASFVRGTDAEMSYDTSDVLPVGTKYKGCTFEENTVLLQFYIKEEVDHAMGDKLVIGNQLKSTTMGLLEEEPYTESGVPIDVIFSSDRIAARVVCSPYLVGIGSRVLERLEESAVDMYFDL